MCCRVPQDREPGFSLAAFSAWVATSVANAWRTRAVSTTPAEPRVTVATTDIWTASREGDVAAVSARIKEVGFFGSKRAFVNAKDADGKPPIFAAIPHEHLPVIRVLLANQLDPSTVDRAGFTALHEAVDKNKQAAAEELLKGGFPVDIRGECGYTPWQLAALNNNFEMANLLRRYRANVNAEFSTVGIKKAPLLQTAILTRREALFAYVVALPEVDFASLDGDGETGLYKAVDKGYLDAAKAIVAAKGWVDSISLVGDKNSLSKLITLAKDKGFTDIQALLERQMPAVIEANRRAVAAETARLLASSSGPYYEFEHDYG